MKKIRFFVLFQPVMVAYGSIGNSLVTPQNLKVTKATVVAQSINDLEYSQVLILLLVTVFFLLLFGLAVYQIVRRLIRIGRAYRRLVSYTWIDEPDAQWKKAEEPDFNLGMFIEQQLLSSQLFSQSHEDGDTNDFVDLPHDWWS